MATRKQMSAKDLKGLFIYQDPKRGCVYYDIFTKNGYILTNSDVKTYNIYSLSLPIGIMAAYVLTIINVDFWIAAVIGLVIYIGLKLIFKFKYIYTLPVIPNYQRPDKDGFITSLSKKYSPTRLAILLILLVGIVIATFVNAKMSNYEGINLYLNYAICAGVGIVALLVLIAFIKSLIRKK